MSDIKVNKIFWDALSDAEKLHITGHLHEYGVLKSGQNIVADTHTPPPSITCHINDSISGVDEDIKAPGLDWLCRAICDSTKSETDCSLYGQSVPACLGAIAGSRKATIQIDKID